MTRVHSFPPLGDSKARVLILGSMPGKASLRAQRYYAHPRNGFWPIMQALFSIDVAADYATRCERLLASKVALWDVLRTCTRSSSLDSDIQSDSIIANDFAEFFAHHRQIRAVFFNGAAAEKIFCSQVLPNMSESVKAVPRHRLPSTSPAHAVLNLEQKLAAWRIITSFTDSPVR